MDAGTVGATLEEGSLPDGERVLLVMERDVLTRYSVPANRVLRIGRASCCDVVLRDPLASRSHAVLYTERGLQLEDLGSHNGTRLRNARLPPKSRVSVELGDPIQVGGALLIVHNARRGVPLGRDAKPSSPSRIVRDPTMQAVYALVKRVATSSINVLVSGETGVGKELVAEAVHSHSGARSGGPYVRINCAALTESLFESELFGHERGAFTGAVRSKPGLLEAAHQGTAFLDEVGELSLAVQAKLLRVLESRQITRVGGVAPRPIDVRFVAATNRDLKLEVARGAFREDLFFRLAGVRVAIPPLRERPSEIAPLTDEIALGMSSAMSMPVPRFSEAARRKLELYAWPGNIRELRNVIEAAVLRCDGLEVTCEHLPEEVRESDASTAPGRSPETFELTPGVPPEQLSREQLEERARILDGLSACNGNQTRAAELLGIPRRTLVYKLAAYSIPRPRSLRRSTPS